MTKLGHSHDAARARVPEHSQGTGKRCMQQSLEPKKFTTLTKIKMRFLVTKIRDQTLDILASKLMREISLFLAKYPKNPNERISREILRGLSCSVLDSYPWGDKRHPVILMIHPCKGRNLNYGLRMDLKIMRRESSWANHEMRGFEAQELDPRLILLPFVDLILFSIFFFFTFSL